MDCVEAIADGVDGTDHGGRRDGDGDPTPATPTEASVHRDEGTRPKPADVAEDPSSDDVKEDEPAEDEDDGGDNRRLQLFDLPWDLLVTTLRDYCDGLALSTALVAFVASGEHRSPALAAVDAAARARVDALRDGGGLIPGGDPVLLDVLRREVEGCDAAAAAVNALHGREEGGGRRRSPDDRGRGGGGDRSSTAAAGPTDPTDPSSETDESEGDDGHSENSGRRMSRWGTTTTTRRHCGTPDVAIWQKLAALSFLEDRGHRVRTPDGIELPLWSGPLHMRWSGRGHDGMGVEFARENPDVLATAPVGVWNHRMVEQWSKFDDGRVCLLKPTARRAIPLPPVIRVAGRSRGDAEALKRMAWRLRATDEVACISCAPWSLLDDSVFRSPAVIFMSRRQALERFASQTLVRRRPKGMWPIDYCFKLIDKDETNDGCASEVSHPNMNGCLLVRAEGSVGEDGALEEDQGVHDDDDLFGFVSNSEADMTCCADTRRVAVDAIIRLMKSFRTR